MSLAPAVANNVLNAILRATAYTGPASVYVSLHTGDPGTTGANEVTNSGGSAYARQASTFSTASGGATSNNGTLTFTNMPALSVQYVGLFDASSGGNFIAGGALTANKTMNLGDSFVFNTTNLAITES